MSLSIADEELSGRRLCVGLTSGPVWRVWVRSWSLDNEEALAHWGLSCHKRTEKVTLAVVNVQHHQPTNQRVEWWEEIHHTQVKSKQRIAYKDDWVSEEHPTRAMGVPVREIIIIIFINCSWVITWWQWLFYMYTNMKRTLTRKFKSGGLHERHVVATWKLGNHLSIRLETQWNQEKPVSMWPVAGPSGYWLLASSPASKVNEEMPDDHVRSSAFDEFHLTF
jgi:hypothetical protein